MFALVLLVDPACTDRWVFDDDAAADEEAAKPDENAGEEDEAAWRYEITKDFNDQMREFANRDWKLAEAEEALEQEVDEEGGEGEEVKEEVVQQRAAVRFMKHTMKWTIEVLHDATRAVALLPPEVPSMWNY